MWLDRTSAQFMSLADFWRCSQMDASDVEVTNLLESYRLSHERYISNSALGTSPSFKADAKFRSTGKLNTEKGKKRSVEEEQEQEQKGGKEGDEGRGHTINEENKDEAYGEDEGPSTKRQKRGGTEGGRWQGFEEELDLAGATPSAAPVFYRFADTGLQLRFKG